MQNEGMKMLWVLLFWVMINIGFNKQTHSQPQPRGQLQQDSAHQGELPFLHPKHIIGVHVQTSIIIYTKYHTTANCSYTYDLHAISLSNSTRRRFSEPIATFSCVFCHHTSAAAVPLGPASGAIGTPNIRRLSSSSVPSIEVQSLTSSFSDTPCARRIPFDI